VTTQAKGRGDQEPGRGDGLRFEATVHPGARDVAMARVADLDLDRVPDPQGGVRLLVTPTQIAELLDRGYEVRLHRNAPIEPLSPDLLMDDEAAVAWLEDRVEGVPRAEGS
jgi:hypothetical protein